MLYVRDVFVGVAFFLEVLSGCVEGTYASRPIAPAIVVEGNKVEAVHVYNERVLRGRAGPFEELAWEYRQSYAQAEEYKQEDNHKQLKAAEHVRLFGTYAIESVGCCSHDGHSRSDQNAQDKVTSIGVSCEYARIKPAVDREGTEGEPDDEEDESSYSCELLSGLL